MSPVPGRASTPDEQLAAASAQFDAHHYAAAAQTLEAFLKAHPTHPKAGAAALALGRCRSELKQWTLAIPAYQQAIAAKEADVTTYADLGLGEAALHSQKWQIAADALEAATQADLTPQQGAIAWDWLGQSDAALGRFGPADQAYQTVITRYSQSDYAADAYFGAGLAELHLGHTDTARDTLKTLTQKFPGSPDVPVAEAQLGQIALQSKHWHTAQSEFEAALGGNPALDAINRQAAQEGEIDALLGLGDDAGASAHMQSLLDALPPNAPQRPQVELTLGNALYRQKKYDAALTAYDEAAKSADPKIAAQGDYWGADTQLALGYKAEAARLFGVTATKFPTQALAPKARLRAGEALSAAGQTAAATAAFQEVIAKYPASPEAKLARAALGQAVSEETSDKLQQAHQLLDAGHAPAALTVLNTLLAGHPSTTIAAQARYLAGTAENSMNKAAPAVAQLSEAIAEAPNADWVPDAQTQLAWLYLSQKDSVQAVKAANAALTAQGKPTLPPSVEVQARLALVQADIAQKNWDAASTQCQALLAENPPAKTAATALYTQAWIADQQNHATAALPLWQKLSATYPDSPYEPEALLEIANAAFTAKQYADAASQYAALLTRFPNAPTAPEAGFKQGSSLYDLGKYTDAAAAFDQLAAQTSSGSYQPEGLYWAGVSYEKADESPQAIERLTKLVSTYPNSPHIANAKIRLAALKAVAGPTK